MSPNYFQVTCPCFHLLYASLSSLSFVRSSFFTIADLPPSLLGFLQIWMNHSWAWMKLSLNPYSWTRILSRRVSHGILPSRSLNKWKSSPLKSRLMMLLSALLPHSGSWTSSPHGHNAASSFHIVTSCSLFASISPHWLFNCLCQKVIINTLQKTSGLLVPCQFVPLGGIRVVEVPHKDQENSSSCLKKVSSTFSSWSVGLWQISATMSPTLICPFILTHKLSPHSWPTPWQHSVYSPCSPM